jgi:hypothetical protein
MEVEGGNWDWASLFERGKYFVHRVTWWVVQEHKSYLIKYLFNNFFQYSD